MQPLQRLIASVKVMFPLDIYICQEDTRGTLQGLSRVGIRRVYRPIMLLLLDTSMNQNMATGYLPRKLDMTWVVAQIIQRWNNLFKVNLGALERRCTETLHLNCKRE